MKRKKRLQKGIDSLDEQIIIHKEKRQQALELGQEELIGYYDKEISNLKKRRENREDKLDRE